MLTKDAIAEILLRRRRDSDVQLLVIEIARLESDLREAERSILVRALAERPQTIQEQVREFHEKFGVPILPLPAEPPVGRVILRWRLIKEEVDELARSLGQLGAASGLDLARVADDLADIAYVVEGACLEFGIDSAAVLAEVHRANMAKVGGPVREDGKILKPEGWKPPDIASVLARQRPLR